MLTLHHTKLLCAIQSPHVYTICPLIHHILRYHFLCHASTAKGKFFNTEYVLHGVFYEEIVTNEPLEMSDTLGVLQSLKLYIKFIKFELPTGLEPGLVRWQSMLLGACDAYRGRSTPPWQLVGSATSGSVHVTPHSEALPSLSHSDALAASLPHLRLFAAMFLNLIPK